MLMGEFLLVVNLFFPFVLDSYAQEEDESGFASDEGEGEDPGDETTDEAPVEKTPPKKAVAKPKAQPQPAPQPQPEPTAEPAPEESTAPATDEGSAGNPPADGAPASEQPTDATATSLQEGSTDSAQPTDSTAATPPPAAHGHEGSGGPNPLVYVFGGIGGLVGLFSLYTFYRRKKSWDEISDAMHTDGGDIPMGSQPPSQFNTQDIVGIANSQVSRPISEIKD